MFPYLEAKAQAVPRGAKKPAAAPKTKGKAGKATMSAAGSSGKAAKAKGSAARPLLWDKTKDKDLQQATATKKVAQMAKKTSGGEAPVSEQDRDDANMKADAGDTGVGLGNEKAAGSDVKEVPAMQPAVGEIPMTAATEGTAVGRASDKSVAPDDDDDEVPATQPASGDAPSSSEQGTRTPNPATSSSASVESRYSPHEVLPESAPAADPETAPAGRVGDGEEQLSIPLMFLAAKMPRERRSATSDVRAKMVQAHVAVPTDAPPVPRKPYATMDDVMGAVKQYGEAEGFFFRIRSTKSVASCNEYVCMMIGCI
ncbi:hypothetical protein BBJ28_00024647 [Nothophytophthora sp. Chile5]|nr:hypothetical protein BBJ28_00024647 [Nothophytophthora sp. Chile5]